jgi:acyl-CoA synthetase (AMP-forming)/AMP-acid ligase II
MAETSGYCTLGEVQSDGAVTTGRPLATRAYVLDRRDRPVPVGVPGELVIAGEGVVAGYLDDGDDAGLIPDPFASGRALRTGERARWWADGQLELAARGRCPAPPAPGGASVPKVGAGDFRSCRPTTWMTRRRAESNRCRRLCRGFGRGIERS